MPLATILGVCAVLLAAPGAGSSRPAGVMIAQSGQTGQQSPQPDTAPPEAAKQQQKQKSTQPPPPGAPQNAASQQAPSSAPGKGSHRPAASAKRSSSAPRQRAQSGSVKKSAHPQKPGSQAKSPAQVVVPNGSTTDPKVQLAPGVSQQQAFRQRRKINQLLAACNTNLKKLSGRQLNPSQREMVGQIRMYVKQARAAVGTSDLQRAENLATKANLLADNLAKP
jgi:hypothetical protein